MPIFNDKTLKGVADAVSKIMDEELKGSQHKIDANKNGKIDAHDFKLLRGKKDMKKEEAELDEAFPTVADAKKRMNAGKTATGSVTKTKTGLVHKRDGDTAATDTQKKASGYGARQNFERSSRVNEKPGKYKKVEKIPDDRLKIDTRSYKVTDRVAKALDNMRGPFKEERLSFTEMLQLYNESGIEVINKIAPQTVKFGDTEVEVIDADLINGTIETTVVEEVDNETFTKEVEAQKAKNAGGGKKAEVAKASVQAVKQEAVEQIDEISADLAGKYLTAPQGKGANKYKTGEGKSSYPNADTMIKHGKSMKRALQRADTSSLNKKPSYYKEEEQLDEVSKKTLGSYIKAASHDVAAKGAFTRHFADKSRAETAEQKHDIARKTMKKADKMQDAGMKRRANMAKAVDRLTKEDVELDERTLTKGETSKKEDYVKGMKKSVSGFKERYGDKAKSVMYATATNMAKKD